jgi:hypothetical protein
MITTMLIRHQLRPFCPAAVCGDLQLPLGYLDRRHPRAHPHQYKRGVVVAAADHTGLAAVELGVKPMDLLKCIAFEREFRLTHAPFPEAVTVAQEAPFRKLEVVNRTQAIIRAHEVGLLRA